MGLVEQSMSAISAPKGYVEMATGCPRFPGILAKYGPISARSKQPSCRGVIEPKDSLSLDPFPNPRRSAAKNGETAQLLSAIRVGPGDRPGRATE